MTESDLESAAQQLGEFPAVIRRSIASLSEEALRWKKSPSDFSIIENVCHLRDIEREGHSVRLDKLLDKKEPFMPDLDGGRLARERDYNSQPIQKALEEFSTERMANVAVIRGLLPDQLTRSGFLETVGTISVEQLIGRMQEHDREHLELIEGLRSRG